MKKLIILIGLMISSQSMAEKQACLEGGRSDESIIRTLVLHQKIGICYSDSYVMRVPGGLLYVTTIRDRSYSSARSIPPISVSSTFVPYNFRDN